MSGSQKSKLLQKVAKCVLMYQRVTIHKDTGRSSMFENLHPTTFI